MSGRPLRETTRIHLKITDGDFGRFQKYKNLILLELVAQLTSLPLHARLPIIKNVECKIDKEGIYVDFLSEGEARDYCAEIDHLLRANNIFDHFSF